MILDLGAGTFCPFSSDGGLKKSLSQFATLHAPNSEIVTLSPKYFQLLFAGVQPAFRDYLICEVREPFFRSIAESKRTMPRSGVV